MVEHSPVYTIGLRSEEYSEKQQEELQNYGAQFIKFAYLFWFKSVVLF